MFSPALATEQVRRRDNRRASPFLRQDERDQQPAQANAKTTAMTVFFARHKTRLD